MGSEYDEFVAIRCQRALEENDEYMKKERSEQISQEELQAIAEKLCYLKGFEDCLKMYCRFSKNVAKKCSQKALIWLHIRLTRMIINIE